MVEIDKGGFRAVAVVIVVVVFGGSMGKVFAKDSGKLCVVVVVVVAVVWIVVERDKREVERGGT